MLALLAVVAQLWVSQVGAEHLARLLSVDAPWGDICSAQDGNGRGDPGHSSHLRNALSCPVCSASASGSAPPLAIPALPIMLANATAALPIASASQVHGDTPAALLPPSQAPPAAA